MKRKHQILVDVLLIAVWLAGCIAIGVMAAWGF